MLRGQSGPGICSRHILAPRRYGISYLVPAMWGFLRMLHATAHLTLTVSPAMVDELVTNRAVNSAKQVQVSRRKGAGCGHGVRGSGGGLVGGGG